MTEWMCWFSPVWIRRGDSIQKAYLEEEEKVDVGGKYASGSDSSLPNVTATKSEGVLDTQDQKRTSMREARRHRVKRLVLLTHHHGSTRVPKRTMYLGDLREVGRP